MFFIDLPFRQDLHLFRKLFGSKKNIASKDAEKRKLLFDRQTISVDAVTEAIDHLGLLHPIASVDLLALIPLCRNMGHKAVSAAFRKEGEQLTREEKKNIGVRSNGYFSRKAFDQLTELGRKRAIDAHFLALWRADFTIHRASQIISASNDEHGYLTAMGEHKDGCDICKKSHKLRLSPYNLSPFPPSQCAHEACCMHYLAFIDWAAKAN